MVLEHARHQGCDRVMVEVGRKIGQPDALVAVAFAAPQRILRRGIFVRGGRARTGKLIAPRVRQREALKRDHHAFSRQQAGGERCSVAVQVPPIAGMEPAEGESPACIRRVGIEPQQGFIVQRRLFVAPDSQECIGTRSSDIHAVRHRRDVGGIGPAARRRCA